MFSSVIILLKHEKRSRKWKGKDLAGFIDVVAERKAKVGANDKPRQTSDEE